MRAPLAAGFCAAALALVIIALAGGIGEGSGTEAATRAPAQAGAPVEQTSGRAVFARMGCGSCHTLAAAGSKGELGPNLDSRLGGHTRESLIAAILVPPSRGSFPGMPTDFGSRMDAREFDALVDFLLAAR